LQTVTWVSERPGSIRRLRALVASIRESNVYFLAFQVAASGALLVGHFVVTVRDQLLGSRDLTH
jgi:hypothetical protein